MLGGDQTLLCAAEERAKSEVNTRLAARYDLSTTIYPILPYSAGNYLAMDVVEVLPESYNDGDVVVKSTQYGYKSTIYKALADQAVDESLNPEDAPELWAAAGATTLYQALSDTTDTDVPGSSVLWQAVTDRSSVVIGYMVDIALYHIYKRTSEMPDHRLEAYKSACSMLIRAGQGQADIGLPLAIVEQRSLGAVRSSSRLPHRGWAY